MSISLFLWQVFNWNISISLFLRQVFNWNFPFMFRVRSLSKFHNTDLQFIRICSCYTGIGKGKHLHSNISTHSIQLICYTCVNDYNRSHWSSSITIKCNLAELYFFLHLDNLCFCLDAISPNVQILNWNITNVFRICIYIHHYFSIVMPPFFFLRFAVSEIQVKDCMQQGHIYVTHTDIHFTLHIFVIII